MDFSPVILLTSLFPAAYSHKKTVRPVSKGLTIRCDFPKRTTSPGGKEVREIFCIILAKESAFVKSIEKISLHGVC